MKRIVLCASLLAIALVCSACSEDDPQVRVQTMFVSITYGIKFQDAEWGPIGSNITTNYQETDPGMHCVQLKNERGEWVNATEGELGPVKMDKKYTLMVSSSSVYLRED